MSLKEKRRKVSKEGEQGFCIWLRFLHLDLFQRNRLGARTHSLNLRRRAMADEILFALKDGIATITMNRPEKRNALNTVLLEGFNAILSHVEESKEARVVVIRGEGKAFCSGIDLRELSSRQTAGADPETNVVQVFQRIERSRIPTIAMVHGDALAGGCELALHCDLRVAAEPARIGMPLSRLGLIVPFPLGQKL